MPNKLMSHDEMQHLEHQMKVLDEFTEKFKELEIQLLYLKTEYLPALTNYMQGILDIKRDIGLAVVDILKSANDLKSISGKSNEVLDYVRALDKLMNALSEQNIAILKKVIG
jgi:hypothetical protein